MDEYKKYLADRLLSEEQPITYRLLSRALDVHVNTAKEMLYDYHAYQNKEKPDSIHATYLISGRKRAVKAENGGDVEMSSSMPDQEEPHSEDIPTTTLTLVGEEKLQDTLAGYEDATCIHIYSLAPHPQRDLALLSDMSKALSEYSIKEQEPKYGAIVNHHVRRRDKAARTKAAAPSSSKPAKTQPSSVKSAPSAEKVKQEPSATKVKQELAPEPPKEATQSSNVSKPPPSTKRGAPGGIMQSFAKAASKPPKPKPQPKEEGTSMALSDDGEADDEDIIPSKKTDKDNDTGRKSRKEREEELRRMMEEDEDEDEDEEDDDSKERVDEEEAADQEMEEAPDPEPEAASQDKQSNELPEIVASTENGRRRGKRRVMQKKRILDDQGYMVTIQEPGWESFSEDEAPPPAKKIAPAATPTSSGDKGDKGEKAKKPVGKGGQGNIMSFFSKK